MKAEELRIGNLYSQFGNIHKVSASILAELENAPDSQLWCKPIPLTEEWLVKLGFEPLPFVNILNSYTKSIGRGRIISIGNVGTTNEMIWLCEVNATDSKKIDDLVCVRNYDYDKYTHVHSLQNLYYNLCGEELTLI